MNVCPLGVATKLCVPRGGSRSRNEVVCPPGGCNEVVCPEARMNVSVPLEARMNVSVRLEAR